MADQTLAALAADFRNEFERMLPDMLSTLQDLVELESFTFEGAHVDAVGSYIADWLKKAGFATARRERPANQDAKWAGLGRVVTARTHKREAGTGIAIIGHMDTVFPEHTIAERPFRIDGNYAFGPGVADMKGGIVTALYVARLLKQRGLLSVPLTLLMSPEEEALAPAVYPQFAEELKDACAIFSAEPGFPGGGITVERFGCGDFRLQVSGVASHAARDYKSGASANLELARQMLAIDRLADPDGGTIVNTGRIRGGSSSGTVSDWAEGDIFMCFKSLEEGERLIASLRDTVAKPQIPGTHCRLSGAIGLYPMRETPGTKTLFEFARTAASLIGVSVHENRTNGSSDAGYCSTMLGVPTLCSMGPEGTGLHCEKEQLDISTIVPRSVILALSILQAARSCPPCAGSAAGA